MRNPGRSGDSDARPDRTDEHAAEAAAVVGVPADGDDAVTRAPAECPQSPDDFGDDLLFDPLLSDEPIDLAAVRADDALIDALGGGDLDVARAVVADDDPLIAMLAAWAASARPDEPEPVPTRPSLTVVGAGDYVESEPGDPGEESVGSVAAAVPDGAPPVEAPALAQDAAPAVAARPGPGLAMVVPLGGAAAPATDLAGADPAPSTDAQMPVATETPATEVPAAQSPATEVPTTETPATETPAAADPAAQSPAAQTPALVPDTASPDAALAGVASVGAAFRRVAPPPVLGMLDRARALRRRTATPGRPIPPGHPLRRAAVVIVVAALGVSGAAATGGTAQPGDPGFAMTRVFFSERAKSLMAAEVVAAGLSRAREYLNQRQPALAARELAAVSAALPDVREEEGHTHLVDQQEVLAAAIAVTPSIPADPRLNTTSTAPNGPDHDTSILAEAAPSDTSAPDSTSPDTTSHDTTPDASTSPADPAAANVVTESSQSDTSASAGDTATTGSTSTSTTSGEATTSGDATPSESTTPSETTTPSESTSPSEVVPPTVGGTTDQGTVTVGSTPTSGTSSGGNDAATAVTQTSTPTTTTPTTSSTTQPPSPSHPTPPADNTPAAAANTPADTKSGTVTVGSARSADSGAGASIAVRPASHDEARSAPAVVDVAPAHGGYSANAADAAAPPPTHAAGSVTAESSAEVAASAAVTGQDAAPDSVPSAKVVVTTVPAPVDTSTKTDKTAQKDTSSPSASDSKSVTTSTDDTAKQQAESSGGPGPSDHGKRGSTQHAGAGHGAVAGARLAGGEVRVRVGDSGVNLSR